MYESQTTETILRRMLDKVPDSLDKREGSIIYDALAPFVQIIIIIMLGFWLRRQLK